MPGPIKQTFPLYNIPEGITETYVHPALETDELKSIVPLWEQRVWEYQVMKDPETEKYLNAHGVELVSYRDIIKMKSTKRGGDIYELEWTLFAVVVLS